MIVHEYHGETAIPYRLTVYVEDKRENDFLVALLNNPEGVKYLVNSNSATPYNDSEVKTIIDVLKEKLK